MENSNPPVSPSIVLQTRTNRVVGIRTMSTIVPQYPDPERICNHPFAGLNSDLVSGEHVSYQTVSLFFEPISSKQIFQSVKNTSAPAVLCFEEDFTSG